MKNKELYQALAALSDKGFFVAANFFCCEKHGWYEIPEAAKDVCFFTQNEALQIPLTGMVTLCVAGNVSEIIETMKRFNLYPHQPTKGNLVIDLKYLN